MLKRQINNNTVKKNIFLSNKLIQLNKPGNLSFIDVATRSYFNNSLIFSDVFLFLYFH